MRLKMHAKTARLVRGGDAMYAAIRQFKAKPGSADALAEKIKEAISIITDVSRLHGLLLSMRRTRR